MKHFEFVLTGGPCSGKTTCLSVLEQQLSQKGFKVMVVPETATELIASGITPWELSQRVFQDILISRLKNKQETVRRAVQSLGQDTVVLYDRGLLDSKAYINTDLFRRILAKNGMSEIVERDHYDAVFHLVSAADGAEQFYTLENNAARTETIEQARFIDQKTKQAWVGHPHLRVIDNSTDFNGKINRLMTEITTAMGIPVPIEIEKKFLIQRPTELQLFATGAVRQQILQVYLKSADPAVESRVRKRGIGGEFSYFYTEKRPTGGMGRIETERKISEREFGAALKNAEKFVRKDRYCFLHQNQYFELDIYPDAKNWAVLEIELTNEAQHVSLPHWVSVIKEVTQDKRYKNAALAKKITAGYERE